jgi:hypothetical protein
MNDDEFESVRTLIHNFDIDPITRPDADDAIRQGLRHRRIRALDKVLAVAAVAAVVAGGAYFATTPLRAGTSTVAATQAAASKTASASKPPATVNSSTPAGLPCDAVVFGSPAAQQPKFTTAQAAIAAFVASDMAPAGMAKTGWTSTDGTTYVSGKSTVQVAQPTPGSFAVISAGVCG